MNARWSRRNQKPEQENSGSGLIMRMRLSSVTIVNVNSNKRERIIAVTYAGSPACFFQRSWYLGAYQKGRRLWERSSSLAVHLGYVTEMNWP